MLHAVGKVQQAFLCAYVLNDRGNCVARLLHLPDRFLLSIFKIPQGISHFAFRIFLALSALKKCLYFRGIPVLNLLRGSCYIYVNKCLGWVRLRCDLILRANCSVKKQQFFWDFCKSMINGAFTGSFDSAPNYQHARALAPISGSGAFCFLVGWRRFICRSRLGHKWRCKQATCGCPLHYRALKVTTNKDAKTRWLFLKKLLGCCCIRQANLV